MLNKKKPTFLTATQSFTVEMLRATMKEFTGSDVYITQVKIEQKEFRKTSRSEISDRPYANQVLKLEVEAYFTSLNMPHRHGREGQLPILPKVRAEFVFTNEANGWYNWDLWYVNLDIFNLSEMLLRHGRTLAFGKIMGSEIVQAPKELKNLAIELQRRGPSRFKEDE